MRVPRIHGRFYDCGLFNAGSTGASSPGVTRDSLDFNRSLSGLSCLLQKHRLRYTIKPPAVVVLAPPPPRFISRPRSLPFSSLLSSFFASFSLSLPSFSLDMYSFVPTSVAHRCQTRRIQRPQRENVETAPLTIRASTCVFFFILFSLRA